MQNRAPVSTHTAQLLAQRAAEMRFAATHSESLLWSRLRSKQLGVEFRRQVVVGSRFIVDFLAPAERLVIEVDGAAYHERRRRADESRDRKLRRLGYRVLRLEAELVEQDLEQAVALVRAALGKPPP
jgi:very-short-patch-repair endonuclease